MTPDKKFHISLKGNPEQCHATIEACPLGGEHYPSRAEAMAAYEKENEEFSIPLSVRKTEFANNITTSSTRGLAEALKNAKIRDGANREELRMVQKWLDNFESSWATIPNSGKYLLPGATVGDRQEWNSRFLAEKIPQLFELNAEQKISYWKFASDVTLSDLTSAERQIGSRHQRREIGDFSDFARRESGTINEFLKDHEKYDEKPYKVTDGEVQRYNEALRRANRAAKELDKALKDAGINGYPKTWKDAQKLVSIDGLKLRRDKVIDLSDYTRIKFVNGGEHRQAEWIKSDDYRSGIVKTDSPLSPYEKLVGAIKWLAG